MISVSYKVEVARFFIDVALVESVKVYSKLFKAFIKFGTKSTDHEKKLLRNCCGLIFIACSKRFSTNGWHA